MILLFWTTEFHDITIIVPKTELRGATGEEILAPYHFWNSVIISTSFFFSLAAR